MSRKLPHRRRSVLSALWLIFRITFTTLPLIFIFMQKQRANQPFKNARECRSPTPPQKCRRKLHFRAKNITMRISTIYEKSKKFHAAKTVQNRPYFAANKPISHCKQGVFACKVRLFCTATKPYLQRSNASTDEKLHRTNIKTPFCDPENSCLQHYNRNFSAPQNAYICITNISHIEHSHLSAAACKVPLCLTALLQFFVNGQKNETFLARKRPYSKKMCYFCKTKNKPAAPHGNTPDKAIRTACGGRRTDSK